MSILLWICFYLLLVKGFEKFYFHSLNAFIHYMVLRSVLCLTVLWLSEPEVLVGGSDFYAFPRVDPKSERVAWIQWSHPNMPWDKSELWVGYISENGWAELFVLVVTCNFYKYMISLLNMKSWYFGRYSVLFWITQHNFCWLSI